VFCLCVSFSFRMWFRVLQIWVLAEMSESGIIRRIVRWTPKRSGGIVGFCAVLFGEVIVEGIRIQVGPDGLFAAMPARYWSRRWQPIVYFQTTGAYHQFSQEIVAALMKAYPEDFEGVTVAKSED
jgi:DNA-binding cell septation regulator SpoVG